MKTKNFRFVWVVAVLLLLGCSKDDEGGTSSSLKAGAHTFELNGLNSCNSPGGPAGSIFIMSVTYTAEGGVTVKRIHVETLVSSGEGDTASTATFTDNGSAITYAKCFRFGPVDWVEYTVRLEGSDGTMSNGVKVRIDKPNGAN